MSPGGSDGGASIKKWFDIKVDAKKRIADKKNK